MESIEVKKRLLEEPYAQTLESVGKEIIAGLKNGKKLLIAGNGGSAADAQHFAAEIAGKFETDRPGLNAIALTTNSSNITAIGNDFGFDFIFSRQVEAYGDSQDIFFGISTSGNSKNIIEAMKTAKEKKLITIGLLGNDGGIIKNFCDFSLIVPSKSTARIQECHIMVIHIISKMIDLAFQKYGK